MGAKKKRNLLEMEYNNCLLWKKDRELYLLKRENVCF